MWNTIRNGESRRLQCASDCVKNSVGPQLILCACLSAWLLSSTGVRAGIQQTPATGTPAKFHSSCEIDLNADRRPDLALSIESVRGPEVLALVATEDGYRAFVLSRGHGPVSMTCQFGKEVHETSLGGSAGRTIRTPGAYVVVSQPEGPKAAYVWVEGRFLEIWLSD